MKNKNDILQIIKSYQPIAQKKYGIKPVGIFGSVARGSYSENSDIDIFYNGTAPTLLTLDRFVSDLEQLLESKVDVVRLRTGLNPLLRAEIEREGSYAE